MGWYHVNREGKGYCLGSEYDLKLDMEELGKYLPDRSETENVLRQTAKDAVDTYDEWPLLWKFATLDPDQTGAWDRGETDAFERDKTAILANALHYCFEKRYGYPVDSFVSMSDYDENVMIFCCAEWPSETYNKALAELTEEKLEKQLWEFLDDIVLESEFDLDEEDFELEWCEEYIKE